MDANAEYALSLTSDLHVKWSGGHAGTRMTFGLGVDHPSGSVDVSCTWAATAGEGVVPADLIAKLGSSVNDVHTTWSAQAQTTFAAGAYPVTAYADLGSYGTGVTK